MKLQDIADVRTGTVISRLKKADAGNYKYKLINLKCVSESGSIDKSSLESIELLENVNDDFLTHEGDILIRLSYPYTAVFIRNFDMCGLLIPSHFAIVRVNNNFANTAYVYWLLKRDKNRVRIMQNSSGSTALGTISSGAIADLPVKDMPIEKQIVIGNMMILAEREQELIGLLLEEKKRYNRVMLNEIYNKERNKI